MTCPSCSNHQRSAESHTLWRWSAPNRKWFSVLLGCLTLLVMAFSAKAQPTFSAIGDQSVYEDQPTELIFLSLSDTNVSGLDQIILTATSSNPEVVQATNILFYAYYDDLGHPGLQRFLSITPSFGQTGFSTITVIATDMHGSATNSFVFTVNPPPLGSARFANTNAISIPPQGMASPYASEIVVSNMSGTITNMTVTMSQFSHNYPGDVDMLLVAPDNQAAVVIYSRAGDGGMALTNSPPAAYEEGATNITFTLSDTAIFPLPFPYPFISIPFLPGNYSGTNDQAIGLAEGLGNLPPNGPLASFPSPAPDPSLYTNTPVAMSSFNGVSPNGTWSLYVYSYTNYANLTNGSINGWSLMMATVSPPDISGLTDQSTPVNTPTTAIPFQISDAQTPASNLVLTATSSDPTLVNATNDITFGGSGTNRTIAVAPEANKIGTNTISVIVTDNDGMSATNSFLMAVNQGQVTAAGIVVSNKVYDATTNAVIDTSAATLTGQGLSGADVALDASGAAGAFLDKNVGTNKTVQISGLTLTGTNAGNYILTQPTTTADITSAPLAVTANGDSKVYGQTNSYGSGSTAFTSIGLQNGETIGTVTITASGGTAVNAPVNTYILMPSAAVGGTFDPNNYSITYNNGTLTVTPLAVILAGTRQYDGTTNAAAGILSVANAVVGDDVSLVSGSGALAGANVGSEAITAFRDLMLGGATATNYTLVGGSGSVNITAAILTYVADATNMTYGSAVPALSGTVTGFKGSDNLTNSTTGTLDFTTTVSSTSDVGSYPVTGSGLSANNGNYTFTQAAGNATALSVTGAVLTVSANDVSRAYGQTNPVLTVSYSGFVNGEGTNVLSGSPVLTTVAVTNSPVGSYAITNEAGSLVATNYTLALGNGTLSVTGAVLTVSVNTGIMANNKVYDGTTAATISLTNLTLTGVVGGDMVSLSTNNYTANFTTANVGTNIPVNVSGLTLSGTGASNYILMQPITLAANITPKALTIASGLPSPVITSINLTNGVVTIAWDSVTGGVYRVQYENSLNGGGWTDLSPDVTATNSTATQTNAIGSAPQRFYRVKMLNVGLSANDKVYDGTTTATLSSNNVVLVGVINEDSVNLVTNGYVANFVTANVGTDIPVTISGLTLSGASAGNYTLTQPTGLAADITGKILTIMSVPQPVITSIGLSNGVVTIIWSSVSNGMYRAQYSSDLGSGGWTDLSPDVTATGSTTTQTNVVGNAPQRFYRIEVLNSGITANNKVYDGTTVARISSNNVTLLGLAVGDSVSLSTNGYTANFATPNVGTAIPVTVSGLTLTGANAADYTLAPLAGLTANMTPATLTVSADNISRTYGLPNPSFTASYSGFVNSDGPGILTGNPELSTSAMINSPPGPYDITVGAGTLSAANYVFTFVNGTLTVVATPRLSGISLSSKQLGLTWPTITNETYQLEYKDNLTNATWTPLDGPLSGTGNSITITNLLSASPQRFFRLSVSP